MQVWVVCGYLPENAPRTSKPDGLAGHLYMEHRFFHHLHLFLLCACVWLGFGPEFVQWYIVPMCAALWSSSASDVLGSSAYAMVAFMDNHCMLQVQAHSLCRILGIAPLHI